MEKLSTCEQYAEILAKFKKNEENYSTNKLFMRSELSSMISGGKLWAEECDGTLWFFSDEEDYYSAQFYVPVNQPIRLGCQKKDVLVELTGNDKRYDLSDEQKLINAGFEKYRKYLELECLLNNSIDEIRERLAVMRALGEKEGIICRKAVKKDYLEIRKLWMTTLGKKCYTIPVLTDEQLDEMERYGRCAIICDAQGNVLAASNYWKKDKAFYSHITASYRMGLGGWASLEKSLSEYMEGCTRDVSWVADDNYRSMAMAKILKKTTGKYFWQFIYRTDKHTG